MKRVSGVYQSGRLLAVLREARHNEGMPDITSLVVPYSYSTWMLIVTYVLQVFACSLPIFKVNPIKPYILSSCRTMSSWP